MMHVASNSSSVPYALYFGMIIYCFQVTLVWLIMLCVQNATESIWLLFMLKIKAKVSDIFYAWAL